MTDFDKNILSPPDLSQLMSQIISDGEMGERLVFVEYDPATAHSTTMLDFPRMTSVCFK